jgi:hypothetical protein
MKVTPPPSGRRPFPAGGLRTLEEIAKRKKVSLLGSAGMPLRNMWQTDSEAQESRWLRLDRRKNGNGGISLRGGAVPGRRQAARTGAMEYKHTALGLIFLKYSLTPSRRSGRSWRKLRSGDCRDR